MRDYLIGCIEADEDLVELGYNENSVEIKGLQKIWWSVHNEIEKIKNKKTLYFHCSAESLY